MQLWSGTGHLLTRSSDILESVKCSDLVTLTSSKDECGWPVQRHDTSLAIIQGGVPSEDERDRTTPDESSW